MSRHVFVRIAKKEDMEQFVAWSIQTENNLLDPDVIKYPSTFIYCAFDENGPIAYCPVQQPLFMEFLAINPEASPERVAMALKELTQAVITKCTEKESGEVYFLCTDEQTIEYAKRQQFAEMPWRVLRIKISELEKKHDKL